MKDKDNAELLYAEAAAKCRELFAKKNEQYGSSAFEGVKGIPVLQLWMRLSDVRRKTTRLDNLTFKAAHGDAEALAKLIDDYKDLANYAIIAVAVLEGE